MSLSWASYFDGIHPSMIWVLVIHILGFLFSILSRYPCSARVLKSPLNLACVAADNDDPWAFLPSFYSYADLKPRKYRKYEIHGSKPDEDIIATDCMIACRLSSFKKVSSNDVWSPYNTRPTLLFYSYQRHSKSFLWYQLHQIQKFTALIVFQSAYPPSKMSSNTGNVIGMESLLFLIASWWESYANSHPRWSQGYPQKS